MKIQLNMAPFAADWAVQKLFPTFRTIFMHNMFSPCSSKRRASDKDLPLPRGSHIEQVNDISNDGE